MKKAGPVIACVIIVLGFLVAAFVGGRIVYLQKNPQEFTGSDRLSDHHFGWVTVKVTEAATQPICTIKHRFIHIVPVGTEYYYLALTEDGALVVIRAGKNWLKDNFDSEGLAKDGSVTVTGYVRSLSGDAAIPVRKTYEKYPGLIEKDYFMDANGFRNGLLLMIFGLVPIIAGSVITILYRNGLLDMQLYETGGKVFFAVFMILLLGEIALMLHVFSMF